MADRIEVTVEETQADFERLLDAVARGVEVVIVRHGKVKAKLVPISGFA